MSYDIQALIDEADSRTSNVSYNITYPSRAAAESMRDLVRRLADALRQLQEQLK